MDAEDSAKAEKPIGKKHRASAGVTSAVDETSRESGIKPIQKKARSYESYGNKDDLDDGRSGDSPIKKRRTDLSNLSVEPLLPEVHAKEKLLRYITNREPSIPLETLDKIIVSCSLKPNKYAGDTYEESNYVITYEYRGVVYGTRPEVLAALTSKTKSRPFSSRQEAHMIAKNNVEGLKLPREYRNVGGSGCDQLLLSLGEIRTSFCNPVQLFPVGYEVHIYPNRGSAAESVVKCSIRENNGDLEFVIVGDHSTVKGVTEDEAWNQVSFRPNLTPLIFTALSSTLRMIFVDFTLSSTWKSNFFWKDWMERLAVNHTNSIVSGGILRSTALT